MPRRAFFDAVRLSPFGGRLAQDQVDGQNVILDEWQRRPESDTRWLAYMLATTFHETARTMQPIREHGGTAYFHRMYDIAGERPHVARALGNTEAGDGARFRGRGFVQLTGRANYARMAAMTGHDLIGNPDLAMAPDIAVKILFDGMIGGLFTGRALADYFNETTDWRGARRIVNGLDRADEIAGYARAFMAAVERLPAWNAPQPVASSVPPNDGRAESPRYKAEKEGFSSWLAGVLRAILTGGKA